MKHNKTVVLFADNQPVKLTDLIDYYTEALKYIPIDKVDSAKVRYNPPTSYSRFCVGITIEYDRLETDEEEFAREAHAESLLDRTKTGEET